MENKNRLQILKDLLVIALYLGFVYMVLFLGGNAPIYYPYQFWTGVVFFILVCFHLGYVVSLILVGLYERFENKNR